jgi:hypothetical protein
LVSSGTYIYVTQFTPQTVIQTNLDEVIADKENMLDGVERQTRFTVYQLANWQLGYFMI